MLALGVEPRPEAYKTPARPMSYTSIGSPGLIRTTDQKINSFLLIPLSYRGILHQDAL